MTKKQPNPELKQLKQQAASKMGLTLHEKGNSHLTAKEAGSIGGQMTKMLFESYKNAGK